MGQFMSQSTNQSLQASSLLHRSSHLGSDRLTAAKGSALHVSLRQFRASDPGNNLATARSLGSFPGKRQIRETTSKKDKDFYQLSFGDLTDLRLTLRNRSGADIFGEILDSQGQVFTFKGDRLSVKVAAGKTVENLYETLPSGLYYLRIRSSGDSKNTYQLKLSANNTFPSLPDCGCTT